MALPARLFGIQRQVAAAGWCSLALQLAGRSAERVALPLRCQARAEALADRRTWLDFHGALGDAFEQASSLSTCLNSMGHQAQAVQQGEHAPGLWRRLGEPVSVAGGAIQTQWATHRLGASRVREALDSLAYAQACSRKMNSPVWLAITEHRLAVVCLRLGQSARARQVLTPLPTDIDADLKATRAMMECRLALLAGQPVLQRL